MRILEEKVFDLKCSNENNHTESPQEEEKESQVEEDSTADLRRSTRERKQTDFYGVRTTVADTYGDPASLKEGMAITDQKNWTDATEGEMEYLHANEVWDLVELPKGKLSEVSGCLSSREAYKNHNLVLWSP